MLVSNWQVRELKVERKLKKDEPAKAIRDEADFFSGEADRSIEVAGSMGNGRSLAHSAFFAGSPPVRFSGLEITSHAASDLSDENIALVYIAENILTDRKLRKSYFPGELFSEPAWDILLCLFVADLRKVRLDERTVCTAVGAPLSTATRWIKFMTNAGIVDCENGPTTGQTGFIKITPAGASQMQDYIMSIFGRT